MLDFTTGTQSTPSLRLARSSTFGAENLTKRLFHHTSLSISHRIRQRAYSLCAGCALRITARPIPKIPWGNPVRPETTFTVIHCRRRNTRSPVSEPRCRRCGYCPNRPVETRAALLEPFWGHLCSSINSYEQTTRTSSAKRYAKLGLKPCLHSHFSQGSLVCCVNHHPVHVFGLTCPCRFPQNHFLRHPLTDSWFLVLAGSGRMTPFHYLSPRLAH